MPRRPNGSHEAQDLPQIDKFKELARELEVSEDEVRFEETVKKIVQAPHEAAKPKSE